MTQRAQGTFEYVLLLGGALLIVALASLVLINQSPDVDERKVCAAVARAAVSCFDAQGNFYPDRTFQFNGKQTSCGCAPGQPVPGGIVPPGSSPPPQVSPPPDSCTAQSQSCNPSSSTCCTGLTCTGGLPFIGGDTCQVAPGQPTPSPTPQACQNTPASCGQPGACQDCTQQQVPPTENSAAFCQGNQVVHTQTAYSPSCQPNQTCGFSPTQTTVVDQTCSQTQVCQNAACVPIQDVALIVGNDVELAENEGLQFAGRPLNAEEQALKSLLESYPSVRVSLIKSGQATYDGLKDFKAVAVTDYHGEPFNAEVITKLAADGKKVLLAHDAIGFQANQQPGATGNTFVRPTKPEAFLNNYSEYREYDNYVGVQSGGSAYQAWMAKSIGSADGYGGYGTSTGYATNDQTGGRWAAWGYDPSKLTGEGNIMARQMIQWTLGVTQNAVVVPNSAVALIAKDYAATPSLTEKEQALKQLWEKEGYAVFVVSQSKRFDADYSKAKAITAAEDVNVQLPDFFSRLSDEKPVLLASNGLRVFWPLTESNQNQLHFNTNKGLLANYDAEYENWVDVTNDAKGVARNNWGYGFSQSDSSYGYAGATFYKETSKAKSALFGFDPSKLTGEGKILFQQAVRYVTQETRKDPVPVGSVILVAESYDDVPTLSTTEAALKAFLEQRGHSVHAISQARRFTTDYANAKAVALAGKQPYEFTLREFYLKLGDEKPLLVVHNGVRLMHRLGNGGSVAYTKIQRDSQKAFLKNYDPDEEIGIPLVSGGTSFTKRGWAGWNQLDWTDCCYGGALAYREFGNIKSALFAYDVAYLTSEGQIMLDEILRWMLQDEGTAQTIPEGSVALLVADYDGAVLTPRETTLQNHLTTMGLNVVTVAQKNRFKTDFSKAAFLAIAEKPYPQTLNTHLASLSAAAPRVLLVAESITIPRPSAKGQATDMHVSSNTGPLSRYKADTWIHVKDAAGDAWGHSAYRFGGIWKGVGQSNTCCFGFELWYANKTNIGAPKNQCGVLFGYAPEGLTGKGQMLLDNMVRWLYHDCYLGPPTQAELSCADYEARCFKLSEDANNCQAQVNIPVGSSVNLYKAELTRYSLDDFGKVYFNQEVAYDAVPPESQAVFKNQCCSTQQGICGPQPNECKGGCKLKADGTWDCKDVDAKSVCSTQPNTVDLMHFLQRGSNTLYVSALDGTTRGADYIGCFGEVGGSATVRLCARGDSSAGPGGQGSSGTTNNLQTCHTNVRFVLRGAPTKAESYCNDYNHLNSAWTSNAATAVYSLPDSAVDVRIKFPGIVVQGECFSVKANDETLINDAGSCQPNYKCPDHYYNSVLEKTIQPSGQITLKAGWMTGNYNGGYTGQSGGDVTTSASMDYRAVYCKPDETIIIQAT